jgi:hypothetical protein
MATLAKTTNVIACAGRASTASRLGMAGTGMWCGALRQSL